MMHGQKNIKNYILQLCVAASMGTRIPRFDIANNLHHKLWTA